MQVSGNERTEFCKIMILVTSGGVICAEWYVVQPWHPAAVQSVCTKNGRNWMRKALHAGQFMNGVLILTVQCRFSVFFFVCSTDSLHGTCIAQHFRHDQPHNFRVLHIVSCITNRAVPLSKEKRKSMTEKTCRILRCKIGDINQPRKSDVNSAVWEVSNGFSVILVISGSWVSGFLLG